jgi:hypothetical protein
MFPSASPEPACRSDSDSFMLQCPGSGAKPDRCPWDSARTYNEPLHHTLPFPLPLRLAKSIWYFAMSNSASRPSLLARPIPIQRAVRSSREDRSKPLRNGFLEMPKLPVFENGHLTVGDIQVAVIENQHMR